LYSKYVLSAGVSSHSQVCTTRPSNRSSAPFLEFIGATAWPLYSRRPFTDKPGLPAGCTLGGWIRAAQQR